MKGVAYPLEDGDWVYAREAEKLCEEIATLRTALKLAASRLRHHSVEWEDAAEECESALANIPITDA